MLQVRLGLVCALSFLLLSCADLLVHTTPPVALSINTKIAVASFDNNTKIPLAGEYAKSIAAKTLSITGFRKIAVAPSNKTGRTTTFNAQLQWARHVGANYMIVGRVNQWGRLAWLNCKPLVSVKIQLIHVPSGKTVWRAEASRRGEPRILYGKLTEELVNAMLVRLYTSACASEL